jgi:hypothetical protein
LINHYIFQLRSQRQCLENIPRIPQTAGHIHDGHISKYFGGGFVDLSEVVGLDEIDLTSIPESLYNKSALMHQEALYPAHW